MNISFNNPHKGSLRNERRRGQMFVENKYPLAISATARTNKGDEVFLATDNNPAKIIAGDADIKVNNAVLQCINTIYLLYYNYRITMQNHSRTIIVSNKQLYDYSITMYKMSHQLKSLPMVK